MTAFRLWKTTAIVALTILVIGLMLVVYDWDYVCSIQEFRHTVIVAVTAFIIGILFEMVTGLFGKAECKIKDHHYGS